MIDRDLFQEAVSDGEPNVDRLVEAVPQMMAEARRRRTRASTPAARLSGAGRVWVPRMAAVTTLLVIAALLWPSTAVRNGVAVTDESDSLDGWLVSGSTTAEVSDPVLDAIVRP